MSLQKYDGEYTYTTKNVHSAKAMAMPNMICPSDIGSGVNTLVVKLTTYKHSTFDVFKLVTLWQYFRGSCHGVTFLRVLLPSSPQHEVIVAYTIARKKVWFLYNACWIAEKPVS
jgi:hypothetical protein